MRFCCAPWAAIRLEKATHPKVSMTHDRPCRVCPAVVRSRPLRASSRVRLCRSARRALVCSLSIAHGDSHARRSHTCRWQMAMAGYCTSPLPAAPARPRHERLTDAGSRPTRGYSQVRRAHPTHHPTRGAHARRCTHRPQTYHGHTNIRCPHEHKIPRHEQRPLSADNTKHRLVVCRPSRRARLRHIVSPHRHTSAVRVATDFYAAASIKTSSTPDLVGTPPGHAAMMHMQSHPLLAPVS